MFYKLKKYIAIFTIITFLFARSIPAVLAEDAPVPPAAPEAPANPYTPPTAPEAPTALVSTPVAPSAPTAPSAPINSETAPSAPQNPYTPPTTPSAPTAPTAPTAPASIQSEPSAPDSPISSSNSPLTDTNNQPSNQDSSQIQNPPTSTGISSNGNVGDTGITTGNADNTAQLFTTGNNNLSAGSACCSNSATVINSGNGAGSENNGSAVVANNNDNNQTNSANVANNLNQNSRTGDNSASMNVGDSSITTGDANTTGTVITAVNTNVDGISVAEFNVVDDHVGDLVLDFGAGCVQGCDGNSILAKNTGNGADSTNNSSLDAIANNSNTQTNNADIGSNLTLDANSGSNNTSFNTGGDSSITTGDANVSANALTFANNNISGNVIFGVVNIFGDLLGDIILTEEAMNAACGGSCAESTTAINSGNGANSTNQANASNTTNNAVNQSNDATINNTLVLDAQTGNNDANLNTGGDQLIKTGDANVQANVLNIANSNIDGGNWWLVIVNEAGRWIGRIMGAPDGSNMAGSSGTEFVVDPVTGEITASNTGNGADSTNQANTAQTTNNTTNQTNNAVINNQLNLSANTGGNNTNLNTGGNSNINTGDANIVANLVNFVNNNIVGNGKLVVTMVNVFGSWLGDFVAPGQQKQNTTLVAQDNSTQNVTPVIASTNNNPNSITPTAATVNSQPVNTQTGLPAGQTGLIAGVAQSFQQAIASPVNPNTQSKQTGNSNNRVVGANSNFAVAGINSVNNDKLLTGTSSFFDAPNSNKAISINLAWLLILIPVITLLIAGKKLTRVFIRK